jgi:hypothetical protein
MAESNAKRQRVPEEQELRMWPVLAQSLSHLVLSLCTTPDLARLTSVSKAAQYVAEHYHPTVLDFRAFGTDPSTANASRADAVAKTLRRRLPMASTVILDCWPDESIIHMALVAEARPKLRKLSWLANYSSTNLLTLIHHAHLAQLELVVVQRSVAHAWSVSEAAMTWFQTTAPALRVNGLSLRTSVGARIQFVNMHGLNSIKSVGAHWQKQCDGCHTTTVILHNSIGAFNAIYCFDCQRVLCERCGPPDIGRVQWNVYGCAEFLPKSLTFG